MFDLNKVKFEHDNRTDFLTGSDAPMVFYKNLMRAMATRKRNGGALFILTVKVLPPSREFRSNSPAAKRQLSEYEGELVKASSLIKKNLRSQDFYTRMAVDGFYVLITGERGEESKLLERFKGIFADRALYKIALSHLNGDLSPTDWLTEVDELYFG